MVVYEYNIRVDPNFEKNNPLVAEIDQIIAQSSFK